MCQACFPWGDCTGACCCNQDSSGCFSTKGSVCAGLGCGFLGCDSSCEFVSCDSVGDASLCCCCWAAGDVCMIYYPEFGQKCSGNCTPWNSGDDCEQQPGMVGECRSASGDDGGCEQFLPHDFVAWLECFGNAGGCAHLGCGCVSCDVPDKCGFWIPCNDPGETACGDDGLHTLCCTADEFCCGDGLCCQIPDSGGGDINWGDVCCSGSNYRGDPIMFCCLESRERETDDTVPWFIPYV